MDLQILIRGQSNAIFFAEGDGWAGTNRLIAEVQRLLGFDGVADSVNVLYSSGVETNGTAHGGTAFLGEWMQQGADGVWRPAPLGAGLLQTVGALDNQTASATSVLWLHSEYDSRRSDLASSEWTTAVRQDAALLRSVLGGDAASVPYHFVSAHPYSEGTPEGHQAIRIGMETLAADPAFNARVAARALDINASRDNLDDNWDTVDYGGAHISQEDALLIANRAARTIAEDWAAYARPGSEVALAGGDIADVGPRVVAANLVAPDTIRLSVAQDGGGGFAPLSAEAARGTGWAVSGAAVGPVAAVVQAADTIDLVFAGALPPSGGVLVYGWGYGRLAADGGPGQGNAITDLTGLPIWTPATGVAIGAPPAVPDGVWLA